MKSIIRCCRMRSRSSWTNTEKENKKDPISKMFVVQIDIYNVHCWGDLWFLMICFIVRALISLHSGTKPVFVRWRWESEQHDTSAQEPWEPLSSVLITETLHVVIRLLLWNICVRKIKYDVSVIVMLILILFCTRAAESLVVFTSAQSRCCVSVWFNTEEW